MTSRDDPEPTRLHASPHPLGVQPARRARTDPGPRGRSRRAGVRQPRDHRSRRALRRRRVLQGRPGQGHQADHRCRDVRGAAVDDRQGRQGRRPAVPPDPAGLGSRRLSEPVPPRHRRAPGRLLLQAPDRSGAPREVQRGAHRAVGVPQRRGLAGARGGRLGSGTQPRRRVRRHPRQGSVLPRAPGPRAARAAPAQRTVAPPGPGNRPAAGRDQRPPLRPSQAGSGPGRAPVRRHGQQPRHAQSHEVRVGQLLPEVGRGNGGAVPGPARGAAEHAAHRRDVRRDPAAEPAAHPAFPGPGWRDGRIVAAQGVPEGSRLALRDGDLGAPDAPRLRARRDPVDGLRGLLPDRGRLHPVRPRAGDPDDLPGQRARIHRDLHARDHAGRPDRLRPAVRAVPQPGPGDDAGHRRRLPGRPPGRGDRVCLPEIRPGPRRPDHHLRHDAGPRGHPGRRARPRPSLRRDRPHRQGHSEPARHQARRGP